MPRCPKCSAQIRWGDDDISAWGFPCSDCRANLHSPLLELGQVVAAFLVVGAVVLGPYLELQGYWGREGTFVFWGFSAVAIAVFYACLWRSADFVVKE
jgi:hypothetical protein